MQIGIDLIAIKRFEKNLNRFKLKILSAAELQHAQSLSELALLEFVASRFAIKEAYFKASQNNISFSKITYLNQLLIINDQLLNNYTISISHSQDHVVAVVLKIN